MPLVSSGGSSQVKDSGHNGMESIGICLSVLTLSIFLVREIRTDNHPHPSPPPRAHTLQSHTGQHRASSSYQQNRAQGRGEERKGARGRKPPSALLPSGPAPTPLLRFLIPRNFRNWDGGCGWKNALRVRCPQPTHLPSPALAHLYSKAPSARHTRNSNADRPPPARRGPCGEGGRPARSEPGTPTPSPARGGQPAAGTPPPQI